jgi:hypothetical protein
MHDSSLELFTVENAGMQLNNMYDMHSVLLYDGVSPLG